MCTHRTSHDTSRHDTHSACSCTCVHAVARPRPTPAHSPAARAHGALEAVPFATLHGPDPPSAPTSHTSEIETAVAHRPPAPPQTPETQGYWLARPTIRPGHADSVSERDTTQGAKRRQLERTHVKRIAGQRQRVGNFYNIYTAVLDRTYSCIAVCTSVRTVSYTLILYLQKQTGAPDRPAPG